MTGKRKDLLYPECFAAEGLNPEPGTAEQAFYHKLHLWQILSPYLIIF